MAEKLKAEIETKGKTKELVIRIPLGPARPSASGKTTVIASSHGNVQTDLLIDGHPVTIGLNAYVKKTAS